MGLITGTWLLIIGLFFLVLPRIAMKIFRGTVLLKKEDNKYKIKPHLTKTADQILGVEKAKKYFRIIGIIFIIVSIFAYLSPKAP